ncbi:MAG: nuclear transport factor 2 family protein [Phycisphaerales bacterium]|nr:nuclear transport factor 2 family protein [Phycisphaerales bacterium]
MSLKDIGSVRIVAIASVLGLGGCVSEPLIHSEIRTVMDTQVSAWNAGDIDGFMEHYWQSDELTFSTPEGKIQGWQATLDRYKKKYPTREAMGTLKFTGLTISCVGEDAADVAGRFHLARNEGPLSGRFFLKLRRIDGVWVIVRDHTASD